MSKRKYKKSPRDEERQARKRRDEKGEPWYPLVDQLEEEKEEDPFEEAWALTHGEEGYEGQQEEIG